MGMARQGSRALESPILSISVSSGGIYRAAFSDHARSGLLSPPLATDDPGVFFLPQRELFLPAKPAPEKQ